MLKKGADLVASERLAKIVRSIAERFLKIPFLD
jgi:hypothetical protein